MGPVYWLYSEIQKNFDLKVSTKQLRNDYGDMTSTTLFQIQEQLTDWNVKSLGVSLKNEHLDSVPLPAIVHVKEKSDEFHILKSVSGDNVNYLRFQHGEVKVSRSDFAAKWTGAALLLEVDERSGDPQFSSLRTQENYRKARETAIALLLSTALVQIWFVWPTAFLPVILQVVGIASCMALFLKGIGVGTFISQLTCRQGRMTDCNTVINSRLGRLFGAGHISEIGFLFFWSNLLGDLFSLLATSELNLVVRYSYLCATPITLLLVFYQGVVLRSWCLLCLIISIAVWALSAALLVSPLNGWPSVQDAWPLFYGTGIFLLIWMVVRPSLIRASQSKQLQIALERFRKNRGLFDTMMSNQPQVDPEIFRGDVVLGKEGAPVTVTLVTNPTCAPCVVAHQIFEDLFSSSNSKLRLVYRFAVNTKEGEGISNRVSREIVNLGLLGTSSLNEAVKSWYSYQRPQVVEWMKIHALPRHEQTEATLLKHEMWCKQNKIGSTPTIFIQGRRVSEMYTLLDIARFVRQDLLNETH